MTTNRARAVDIIEEHLEDEWGYTEDHAERATEALDDAGLLTPNGFRTAYGVWFRSPGGEEGYDWIRNDSYSHAADMVKNLRNAGWEAEVVARHVSEPRFVPITRAPK